MTTTTNKPTVSLSNQQINELYDEVYYLENKFDHKPHPAQAELATLIIWDFDANEDLMSSVNGNMDVVLLLAKQMQQSDDVFMRQQLHSLLEQQIKLIRLFLKIKEHPTGCFE